MIIDQITLGEIYRGAASLQTRDPTSADRLFVWLETLRQEYRKRALSVSDDIAIAWGCISAGRPRDIGDGLIINPWVDA